MPLHGKVRFLHEIGGEKSVDGLNGPGMILDVAVGESQFHDLMGLCCIHVCFAPRGDSALYQVVRNGRQHRALHLRGQ